MPPSFPQRLLSQFPIFYFLIHFFKDFFKIKKEAKMDKEGYLLGNKGEYRSRQT